MFQRFDEATANSESIERSPTMLRNHLDMIGRNEPIQRKAKFWQSYVRALKGTDDMRAPDRITPRPRGIFRPLLPLSSEFPELSSSWPYSKSIYDDPTSPHDRITVPGYRYLPVHREIYGYSPRNLYPRPVLAPYDHDKAWQDHLKKLADIDRFYPSKYPLSYRYGLGSPNPRRSATPLRTVSPAPSDKALGFNYAGQPIYTRGGLTRRPLSELDCRQLSAGRMRSCSALSTRC
ncbi:uncharacterized protein LOC134534296 isoform X2 [Bacillus rossius redtenbacheri]|uniref:uncharacterized protein LOC134534296 isoform X2 n=1 Tax=Bacillus rossius redtenbacheri TaxID=93214 RepID=UPI002FDEE38B